MWINEKFGTIPKKIEHMKKNLRHLTDLTSKNSIKDQIKAKELDEALKLIQLLITPYMKIYLDQYFMAEDMFLSIK